MLSYVDVKTDPNPVIKMVRNMCDLTVVCEPMSYIDPLQCDNVLKNNSFVFLLLHFLYLLIECVYLPDAITGSTQLQSKKTDRKK